MWFTPSTYGSHRRGKEDNARGLAHVLRTSDNAEIRDSSGASIGRGGPEATARFRLIFGACCRLRRMPAFFLSSCARDAAAASGRDAPWRALPSSGGRGRRQPRGGWLRFGLHLLGVDQHWSGIGQMLPMRPVLAERIKFPEHCENVARRTPRKVIPRQNPASFRVVQKLGPNSSRRCQDVAQKLSIIHPRSRDLAQFRPNLAESVNISPKVAKIRQISTEFGRARTEFGRTRLLWARFDQHWADVRKTWPHAGC